MQMFERTNLLLGTESVAVLKKKRVAIFGLGGVGGMAVESLARIGVGSFLLIDGDVVSESNLNRQIIALENTIGRKKTEVMKERVLAINSRAAVEMADMFVLEENIYDIDFGCVDYVVDAIDTITSKLAIAKRCKKEGIPIISSMGAGNRLSMNFKVGDIFDTSICPIAKVMRKKLRDNGIGKLKVVYSLEEPKGHFGEYNKKETDNANKITAETADCLTSINGQSKRVRKTIGSIPFAPMCAGLYLASEVINDLIGIV